MKQGSRIKSAAAFLLLVGCVLFTYAKDAADPIINFGVSQPLNGVIKSWTDGVSIKPGSAAEVLNGPPGAKALKFDGTDASVSTFVLEGKENLSLRKVKDISISFAFRLDSEPGADADTGLGMRFNGFNYYFGDSKFKLPGATKLEPKKWYNVSFVYSPNRREAKVFLDGAMDASVVNVVLPKLDIPFAAFGKFDGRLASMQAWNRALTDKEIIQISNNSIGWKNVRGRIETFQKKINNDDLNAYLDGVKKKLDRVIIKKQYSVQDDENARMMATTAYYLAENNWQYKNTSLRKAPFALLHVQAISSERRRPDLFPIDPIYTDNIRVAAAKGEYEAASFVIYAYRPMKDFTVTVSDFKSDSGATLPASIVDRKIVKHWYQSDWNSQYNKQNQVLVPDLLLNDEALVKVDPINRKNYLRVDGKYVDVNRAPEDAAAEKQFNYCIENVKDADTLQGTALTPGLGKQFWFTFAVPKDAQAGLYTATVSATEAGTKVGQFKITLRVYPFELPDPKTNYDRSVDFRAVLAGGADLSRYMALDKANAEKFFRAELANLKSHNIIYPAIPNPAGDMGTFEKDLKIRKEMGFSLKYAFIPVVRDDGTLMNSIPAGKDSAIQASDISAALSACKKAGCDDVTFYGVQSQKDIMTVLGLGGKVMTFGWDDAAAQVVPSVVITHAVSRIDDYQCEKWHALHGRIFSCGALFAGPDNPDLIRRTFGYKIYRASYDGFFLPAFPSAVHCWDERRNPGLYRNQTFAYPTQNGQINTLAYEGLREGIDDIRYITLLRQLGDEAFKKNNQDAIYSVKRAIAIFELSETGIMDLDLLKMELADHIIVISKQLGKEMK